MACENSIGMITIQKKVIRKGYVFEPNTQWCYREVTERLMGCGCGGKAKTPVRFYVIEIDGIDYDIDSRFAVESDVAIPIIDQNGFANRIANVGDTSLVQSHNELMQYLPDPNEIAASANNIPM